jgi:beta-phosphoglucomutase-like phosphatase (HAD superfamily)
VIEAVAFDLDGVILDSEQVWDEVREGLARERGGRWSEQAQADMMGMSSTEWSRYMHDVVGLPEPPGELTREVVRRMLDRYSHDLPLIDGAVEAVKRLADRWPLGVASSSNRELIDRVLEVAGLAQYFRVTVSSEEVARGKPAPDVYLESARRLGVEPQLAVAIEDCQRDSFRPCRRYARRCDSQSCLPAAAGRPRAGRRRSGFDQGARSGSR